MKKIIALLLCLLLVVPSFSACGRVPEFSELEARLRELIDASYEINDILFGEGLAVYEHVFDPKSSTEILRDDETGKMIYYYELEDDTLGRVIAYRVSYLKYSFAEIETEPDQTRTPIYADEENRIWAYAVEYTHEKGEDTDVKSEKDEESGKITYYYEIEDDTLGRVVAYRASYPYRYAEIVSSPDQSRTAIYADIEKKVYAYPIEYTEVEAEFYYDSTDPDDYDYVRADGKYHSIVDIKDAAEKVYSKNYLSSLYTTLFDGVVATTDGVSGLSARYIEYTDDYGTVSLMKSNTYKPLVTEKRIFDLSTAEIVRPKRSNFVTISLESYLESKPDERTTVKLTMILQDGVWMLDSGTY